MYTHINGQLNICGIKKSDKDFHTKGKGKVCIQAKWPTRPELIPVSVA